MFFAWAAYLFGAAICLRVWKHYQVNYMYIFELDHKSAISFIQFLCSAFIILFVELLALYTFLNVTTHIFQEREHEVLIVDDPLTETESERLLELKRNAAIVLCSVFVAIWLNPLNVMQRSFRYGSLQALLNVIIAPFGNVKFKTYLIAEVLTDSSIAILDFGRVLVYFTGNSWNERVVTLEAP